MQSELVSCWSHCCHHVVPTVACCCQVVRSAPGRGKQLNAGWRASRHADWVRLALLQTRLCGTGRAAHAPRSAHVCCGITISAPPRTPAAESLVAQARQHAWTYTAHTSEHCRFCSQHICLRPCHACVSACSYMQTRSCHLASSSSCLMQ